MWLVCSWMGGKSHRYYCTLSLWIVAGGMLEPSNLRLWLDVILIILLYLRMLVDGSIFCHSYKRGLMWFPKGVWYFSLLSNVNPSEKEENFFVLLMCRYKYIWKETNQSKQMKPFGTTFILGKKLIWQPECKTTHGTSAPTRTSGRTMQGRRLLVYTSNFCEGNIIGIERHPLPPHPEQRKGRSGDEESPKTHSFSSAPSPSPFHFITTPP